MPCAIVLAAGLSSRMGSANKLLLPYKDKTVIETVVETILEAGIKEMVVVTGHEAGRVKDCLRKLPVRFAYNPGYASGMTSSIQRGVKVSNGNGYMICLSDMVTITAAEYTFLADTFDKRILIDPGCICVPRYQHKKGNPVIFSALYKDAILHNPKPEGCKNIVHSFKEHLCEIDMDSAHVLQDFDNRDDYEKLHTF